jgi:hypothetical protein
MSAAANKMKNNKSLPSKLSDTMAEDCGEQNEMEHISLALNKEEASTSHSAENLNRRRPEQQHGDEAQQRRNPSKMCRQKRRSDTDITKTR